MKATDRIRMVLIALGYTPVTLSEAIGISRYKAKRILKDEGSIRSDELLQICCLTGISPDMFMQGCVKTKAGDIA